MKRFRVLATLTQARATPTSGMKRFAANTCAAEMLTDHVQMPEFDATKMQTLLDAAYKNNLY